MRKLLPIMLTFLGLAAGAGAGVLFQPKAGEDGAATGVGAEAAESPAAPTGDLGDAETKGDAHSADSTRADVDHSEAAAQPHDDSIEVVGGGADNDGTEGGGLEYVKLSNQFVVPLVDNGQVTSMMVLTLSLEVGAGGGDAVFAREPKLRDALLQVLFDHANADGFRGRFTDAEAMMPLRRALREAAMKVLPGTVRDVLIADIVRHDG